MHLLKERHTIHKVNLFSFNDEIDNFRISISFENAFIKYSNTIVMTVQRPLSNSAFSLNFKISPSRLEMRWE